MVNLSFHENGRYKTRFGQEAIVRVIRVDQQRIYGVILEWDDFMEHDRKVVCIWQLDGTIDSRSEAPDDLVGEWIDHA